MFQVPDNIKQFYRENPEMLAQREFLSMQVLEDYLQEYGLEKITLSVFKEWERKWQLAKSYWVFPEESDMKQLVDKHYKLCESSTTKL